MAVGYLLFLQGQIKGIIIKPAIEERDCCKMSSYTPRTFVPLDILAFSIRGGRVLHRFKKAVVLKVLVPYFGLHPLSRTQGKLHLLYHYHGLPFL
jgi:hypothetical protein